jgi:hypothetical protein
VQQAPRVVLPWLQSILDPMLSEKALQSDSYLGGVSLTQDSDQKDVMSSTRGARHSIKWLFYEPSSEIGSKPFLEVREFKHQHGNMVLESIKKKKKTLRSNKSTTEV